MVKSHKLYTERTPRVLRCGAAMLVAGVVLAACAKAPPPAEVTIGFRNPTVAFGGTSRFEVGRFAGEWQTIACLGRCARSVRYVVATDGVLLREAGETSTPYLIPSPGVLRQMGGNDTLVVMWVDEGFRTAAVGDAQGRWAAILNRSRKPGRDRMQAATEILDFNGWDVSKLRYVK